MEKHRICGRYVHTCSQNAAMRAPRPCLLRTGVGSVALHTGAVRMPALGAAPSVNHGVTQSLWSKKLLLKTEVNKVPLGNRHFPRNLPQNFTGKRFGFEDSCNNFCKHPLAARRVQRPGSGGVKVS